VPPGPPIVGNPKYVEIVLKGNVAAAGSNTKPVYNVFHYRSASSVMPSKVAIDTAFRAMGLVAAVVTMLQSRWVAEYLSYRWLDDANDSPMLIPVTATGAITTDSLPLDNAVVVRMVSGQKGRSGRGSKHYSPIAEIETTGDVLSGSYLTAWQAIRDLHNSSFTEAGGNIWVPTIISRIQNEQPVGRYNLNPTEIISYDVLSVILNATIGTMRRRKTKTVIG
jgi:hypothetical protein